MITRLLLNNFKSHVSTDIVMKPLTIIAGVNNCGKSSILQSLLLLRQSFKNNRLHYGLDLNEPLVAIGTGNDILSRSSKNGVIGITVFANDDRLEFKFNVEKALTDTFIPLLESTLRYGQDELDHHSLFNHEFQYLSADRWGGRSDFPSDTFAVNAERQISKQYGRGELLGNFLFTYKGMDTYDYFDGNGTTIPLMDQISKWENRISENLLLDVQKMDDSNGFSVIYGSKGINGKQNVEGLKANNIGYGVSYSLPILAALLSAKPGALILIENPEAHLHPDGISKLTELMCTVSQRGVQVVIETHSDHVINGTLVNCKRFEKGMRGIDRNNVAIYHLSGLDENHASIVETVDITDGGYLEYQPKGFFDRIETDRSYILGE